MLIVANFGFLSLNAQLLTETTAAEDSLTTGQIDFRQRMLDSAYFLSSKSVEIADFQTLLNADTLDFTIPGLTGNYRAFKTMEYNETAYHYDYLWAGNIENEYPGYVLIMQKDNMFGGYIQTNDKFYAIVPTGDNRGLLMEANPNGSNLPVCETITPETGEGEPDPCEEDYNLCPAEIHALLLLTPEHFAFMAGLEGNEFIKAIFVIMSMEAVNQAFVNSDIPNKRIRYSWTNYTFNFISPPNMFTDLNNLVADLMVKNLRDNDFKADIVVMLSGTQYASSFSPKGLNTNDFPSPDAPYLIVRGPNMFFPDWTIAHEMTHLMRAGHNTELNCLCAAFFDNDPDCSHGWRLFQSFPSELTIQGLPFTDDYRILNFSNPDILYNGVVTGTENDNNAKTIRNAACVVANYRPPAFLGVNLNPPQEVCEDDGSFYISASVKPAAPAVPGHGPFTYTWSATGNNCFPTVIPYPGNEATADVNFTCFVGQNSSISVTVTVTSSDGASATNTVTIPVLPPPCNNFIGGGGPGNNTPDEIVLYDKDYSHNSASGKNIIHKNGYNIYPNPTSNLLNIEIPTGKENVETEILDLTGKVLLKTASDYQSSFELDISNFPDGGYFLKIKDAKETVLVKLLKISN